MGCKEGMSAAQPRLLRVLRGEALERPPIWFMRQAGARCPEYHRLRETAPDFLAFCLDPVKAAEATMQPMRRFAFDAAIVFADILLTPMALGQSVWFEAGEGPRLGALPPLGAWRRRSWELDERLAPVAETLKLVRAELAAERALIGFSGGPWTVATYMINGRGGERDGAIGLAFSEPDTLDRLLGILVDASVAYLAMQARAGAQVLQLFESWADDLAEDVFERLVTGPHAAIVAGLRHAGRHGSGDRLSARRGRAGGILRGRRCGRGRRTRRTGVGGPGTPAAARPRHPGRVRSRSCWGAAVD